MSHDILIDSSSIIAACSELTPHEAIPNSGQIDVQELSISRIRMQVASIVVSLMILIFLG